MVSKAPGNTLSNRIDLLPVKGWHWIMLTVCLLAIMF